VHLVGFIIKKLVEVSTGDEGWRQKAFGREEWDSIVKEAKTLRGP
jgi:hypothetical protein